MKKERAVQEKNITVQKTGRTILIVIFGIVMGIGSKMLDETAVNELPVLLQMLDITNFLGRFGIWIFIAVCISVYSDSARRAALNVFVFFAGMVSSYYLYSALVAGFFPLHYAMIWFGFTIASPFLACICWHARDESKLGIIISAVILGVLFSQAVLLFQGIRIAHVLELILWLMSLWVLKREKKEFAIEIGLSVFVAILWQLVVPYWG
ncbi:MAG: hypothetical protein IJL85_00095 [Erysipelotrichaceae bacterium]|nr:hypothetical protein [Erysipelotrichaceae bacterium]